MLRVVGGGRQCFGGSTNPRQAPALDQSPVARDAIKPRQRRPSLVSIERRRLEDRCEVAPAPADDRVVAARDVVAQDQKGRLIGELVDSALATLHIRDLLDQEPPDRRLRLPVKLRQQAPEARAKRAKLARLELLQPARRDRKARRRDSESCGCVCHPCPILKRGCDGAHNDARRLAVARAADRHLPKTFGASVSREWMSCSARVRSGPDFLSWRQL